MKEFDELIKTVRRLRSPQGCPWDRAQALDDYKKFLLEEAYELIDGIENNNPEIIKEELGDLILILITIAEFFRIKGKFKIGQAVSAVNNKLISRHPHVFSTKKLKTKDEVLAYWIKSKALDKKRKSIKDRLPKFSPSLLMAEVFFKERSSLKKSTSHSEKEKAGCLKQSIIKKIKALDKLKPEKKIIGDIIFALSEICYLYGVEPETALRKKILREADKIKYNNYKP
ncbi:MAG: MazG nucleotide pyrophosphohydrolase domain-containing protein [Candidatus Omnitrophota bacterium]